MHVDLNLLVALDALLEEGSVARAAQRLHLSPPAMSRTLGRIRRVTGDQVLVRTGRTMTPTPHALVIREQVHDLVQRAQSLLAPDQALDLPGLERTFTVQSHDAVTTAISPHLLTAVLTQAPGVRLRLLAEASTDTSELRHGRVDLQIGSSRPVLPEISSERVTTGQLAVAVRPDHPRVRGAVTLEQYAAELHLTVSRRGRLSDPVDEALRAAGVQRTVVASAPTSTAALHIVHGSDLLVVVPAVMCRPTLGALGLAVLPLPLDLPPVEVVLAWHQRYDGDAAHTWLRAQVGTAIRAVGEDPGTLPT